MPEVVTTVAAWRSLRAAHRAAGRSVGFVPTMGALHPGHTSLCHAARRENDVVLVSIFVNPTQFDEARDFQTYPRTLNTDLALLDAAGADAMHRSFAAGSPQRIERVATIADSLGAPMAMPYSYALCRRYVDELVTVDDGELCAAMWLLFADGKLAVEPAGAASTAAMLQLGDRLAGQRIGLLVCGANVAGATFARCLERGAPRDGTPA